MGGGAVTKTQDQTVAHEAQCFMISCMDFRLLDDIVHFMDKLGYNNNYDQFILAGASLGYTQTKYPHWGKSLTDHMEIGLSLHNFREFIFIDHYDCGAFRKFYPEMKTKQEQKELHVKHLQAARDKLAETFPKFNFRGYLMNIKGQVQQIPINNSKFKQQYKQMDGFLTHMQLQ